MTKSTASKVRDHSTQTGKESYYKPEIFKRIKDIEKQLCRLDLIDPLSIEESLKDLFQRASDLNQLYAGMIAKHTVLTELRFYLNATNHPRRERIIFNVIADLDNPAQHWPSLEKRSLEALAREFDR